MRALFALICLFVACITQCSSAAELDYQSNVVRLNEVIRITSATGRSLLNEENAVHGVRQCGGNARSIQWRLEMCQNNLPGPCVVPINKFQRGELTFEASSSADSMGYLVTTMDATKGGEIIAQWRNPNLPESSIQTGRDYTIIASFAAGEELQGKLVTQQLSLYRESDQQVEACAEAEFIIV